MENFQNADNGGNKDLSGQTVATGQFSGNMNGAGPMRQENRAAQGQTVPPQFTGAPYGQAPYMPGPAKRGGKGARVGYFFLALAPVIACLVLQVLCSLAVMILAAVVAIVRSGVDLGDMDAVMGVYYRSAMETASVGVFCYHVVGVLVFGLWYYLGFRKPRPKFGASFRALNGKNILVAVLAGVGLCFFANATVAIESFLLPGIVREYEQLAEAAGLGTDALVIFASIVLAPIGEELLCRGVTLRYARKALPKFWMANCLQALLFGLIHMNWVQGIYAFVIGLVLGWLAERYKSLLPAVILHFVVNFSSSTWVGYVLEPLPYTLVSGLGLLLISAAVVIGALFWGGRRKETADGAPSVN